jgi:hypothetical protein
MAGVPRPSAIDAFESNIADARTLVTLAEGLENRRLRRMRVELREKLGAALKIPRRDQDALDCLESDELFVILKPGGSLNRGALSIEALRPLLRQAVVAVCAAIETYSADRAMELYPQAIRMEPIPTRLGELPMTVGDWLAIEQTYERRGWGLREVVDFEIRQQASADPSVLGRTFSMVGVQGVLGKVDGERGRARGTTDRELGEIVDRRNRIAHRVRGLRR